MMREDKNILDSWKEIASYLNRTVKTCRKWEKELGLPIHRLDGSPRASVFAYKEELDRWLEKTLHSKYTYPKKNVVKSPKSKSIFIALSLILVLGIVIIISIFLIRPILFKDQVVPLFQQMTFNGNAWQPVMSPDEKFIAYVAREAPNLDRIMLQEIDSSQALELFKGEDCHFLRWIPSSSELTFSCIQDKRVMRFVVHKLGGLPRQMISLRFQAWDATGSHYASTATSKKIIRITEKSTGQFRDIKLRGSFLWINDIDWSPVNNLLLIRTQDKEKNSIWTITPDGTKQNKVVDGIMTLESPRWSQTDDTIYFLRGGFQSQELWKVNVASDTGESKDSPSLVLTGLSAGRNISISRNGNTLFFSRSTQHSNLWIASIDVSEEDKILESEQLTFGTLIDDYPSISPDGKMIAFSRGINEESANIFIMPTEGGTHQQITFFNSYNACPVWSPDGNEIAFGSNEGGSPRVWKANLIDGRLHQFVNSNLSKQSYWLSWAPGYRIIYHRPGHRNFYFIDPETEEETPLVRDESVGWIFYPVYSPDKERIAVLWNQRPIQGLFVISLEDLSSTFISNIDGPVALLKWSLDGKWVCGVDLAEEGIKILKFSIEGNKVITAATIPLPKEIWARGSGSISHDEKYIVYSVLHIYSDIWKIDNFDQDFK